MVGELNRGYEISRIPGKYREGSRKARFYALYPYLTLLAIPMCPVMVWFNPNITADLKVWGILFGLAMVLPVGIFGFLVVENTFRSHASPTILYSNGIENVAGRWDAIRKRPSFVPSVSIDHIELNEFSVQQGRGYRTFITVKIRSREGWERFFTALPKESVLGFWETAASKLGVQLRYLRLTDERGKRIKNPEAQPFPALDHRAKYCEGCGEKAVPGASFCGRCGRKL